MKKLLYIFLALLIASVAGAARVVDIPLINSLDTKYGNVTGGEVSRLSGISTIGRDGLLKTWRGDRENLCLWSENTSNWTGDQVQGVWGDGNFIYIANFTGGLHTYSVDVSGFLTHIDADDQGDNAFGVWGDGDFIYLANYTGGLHTYSVDVSGFLTHIDFDAQAGRAFGVWGDGNFIYLANRKGGLHTYSVDGSGFLTHIDFDDQGDYALGVWGDGNFIYLANYTGGLHTYSVDGSGFLTHIDFDNQGGQAYGVWGDGNLIYLANGEEGLHTYSVDVSGNLTHIDFDDQGDNAYGVWGDGNFIYLANYTGGLHTYSVDGSGFLTHIDFDAQAGRAYGVWGDGNFIYLANYIGGLHTYSVDVSGFLTHIDFDIPTSNRTVNVEANTYIVSTHLDGVTIEVTAGTATIDASATATYGNSDIFVCTVSGTVIVYTNTKNPKAQLEKLEGPIQGTGVELVTDGTFDDVTDDSGELSSGSLTIGDCYLISAHTGVNFTADGAPDNNVGTYFNATSATVTLDADDKVFPVTFDNWTAGTGWAPQATAGALTGKAQCDGSQAANSKLYQDASVTENKYYQAGFTVSGYSAGNVTSTAGATEGTDVAANASYTQIIKAGGTAEDGFVADSAFIGTIDTATFEEVTCPGPLEPGTYTKTEASTVAIPAEAPFGKNGLQHQGAGINYCLKNQDFSNATWTKSNMTTGSATGTDGTSDTIRLTASAADATCLQTIATLSNTEHTTSVYVKRVTGSGVVSITDNNGVNWTALTDLVSDEWTRYDVQRTQTDPVIGIKIATDTDVVDVDLFQVEEDQAYPSAPIITDDVPVARATSQDYPRWTMGQELKNILSDVEGGADSSGVIIFKLKTGYAEAAGSGDMNIFTLNASDTAGIYIDHASAQLKLTDGTNTAVVAFAHAADTEYIVAAYWDKTADDLNIGVETGGSWIWGTAQAYDNVFPLGTYLQLAYDAEYPFDIEQVVFFDESMEQKHIENFKYYPGRYLP